MIYETGAHSVACYDTDDEALSATGAHNDRAKNGGRSLESEPTSPPAERVKRILKYDRHPADYGMDQTVSTEVFHSELDPIIVASTNGGVVDLNAMRAAIRELSSPLKEKEDAHDSNFKMPEDSELELPWSEVN